MNIDRFLGKKFDTFEKYISLAETEKKKIELLYALGIDEKINIDELNESLVYIHEQKEFIGEEIDCLFDDIRNYCCENIFLSREEYSFNIRRKIDTFQEYDDLFRSYYFTYSGLLAFYKRIEDDPERVVSGERVIDNELAEGL